MSDAQADQALAVLRIQLFTAAQRLKGDHLEQLKTLVIEVAQVLDVQVPR